MAALHFQVAHLCQHNAPINTPLAEVYLQGIKHVICGDKITTTIQSIIHTSSPKVGFTETDVSARYLQVGRAMALLLAQVDTDTIHLVGRWQSNTMLRYLHTTAKNFTQGLAMSMVHYGTYALIPPMHAYL